jgi:Fe2+ transport system protein B
LDWQVILREIITGGAHIAVLVPAIIIPLMAVLALLTDSHLLDRGVGFIQPVMQRLNLSNRAAFPLLAGLFLGIVFGSGVIISFANDGTLTKRDLILVIVFLGICHSIIEDTLIFAALGANCWVLVSCRFVLAALATFAVSFVLPSSPAVVKTN